jgi:hypothetical protein
VQRYDPLEAPDPEEWMELDEQERIDLVRDYHRRAGKGLDRHDAIHAIGMVLAEHLYDMLKTTKSDKDPNAPYFAALERLTAEDWRRSQ